MKVSSNVSKPPKKKVTGMTQKTKLGAVVKKGSPTKVTQTAERGTTKTTYTPGNKETGHEAYGKVGQGTDPEMNRLLNEARAKKRDVTAFGTSGRTKDKTYAAGTTTVTETPATFKTKVDINPTIRKVETERKPIYEETRSSGKGKGDSGGKLKARRFVAGGESKKGGPATKYGIGTPKKFKIRKTVTH